MGDDKLKPSTDSSQNEDSTAGPSLEETPLSDASSLRTDSITSPSDTSVDVVSQSSICMARDIITYERDFMLHLRKSEFSINPRDDLLWPDYVNDGLYDKVKWKRDDDTGAGRSGTLTPDYIRPMKEVESFRPQRKSFVSGCYVNSDKATTKNGSVAPESPRDQTRRTERSNGEKKVGSGRLILERSDARRSDNSRGSEQRKDGKMSLADRRDNWRVRTTPEFLPTADGHYNKPHRNNQFECDEPEWLNEDISQSDTIELKGFDAHEAARPSNNKSKTKEKKPAKKVSLPPTNKEPVKREERVSGNENDGMSQLSSDFDFNQFVLDVDPMHLPMLGSSTETTNNLAEQSGSRFSRWFTKAEDPPSPSKLTEPLTITDTGLHSEEHMGSLLKGIVDHSLLSPNDQYSAPSQPSPSEKNKESSELMNMLGLGYQSTEPQTDLSKQALAKEKIEAVPDIFAKLMVGQVEVSEKPPLPNNFKTLEELESGVTSSNVQPVSTSESHTTKQQTAAKNAQGHSKRKVHKAGQKQQLLAQQKKEIEQPSAYDKLLDMLKVNGELPQNVPKMPEITNTDTPNQMKNHAHNNDNKTSQGKHNQDNLNLSVESSARGLHSAEHTRVSSTQHGASRDIHPSNPVQTSQSVTGQTNPMNSLSNLFGVIDRPNQALGNIPLSAINPVLQQTIAQQQRQKQLTSPVMFGTQPPVHVAAPAPIHPLPPVAHHLIGQAAHQQASMSQQALYRQSQASPIPQMSVAFTPTSVIRKLANDKADEKHKINENQNNLHLLLGSLQGQQQVQQQQLQQQQLQQQQHMLDQQQGRRPIVKNNMAPNFPMPMPQYQHPGYNQQAMDQQALAMALNNMAANSAMQSTNQNLPHPHLTNQQQHMHAHLSNHHQIPVSPSPGVPQLLALQQQLSFLQMQQPQVQIRRDRQPSPDNLSKWFSNDAMNAQHINAGLPLPNNGPILKLEDIEH